jgi:hypothetical protein
VGVNRLTPRELSDLRELGEEMAGTDSVVRAGLGSLLLRLLDEHASGRGPDPDPETSRPPLVPSTVR